MQTSWAAPNAGVHVEVTEAAAPYERVERARASREHEREQLLQLVCVGPLNDHVALAEDEFEPHAKMLMLVLGPGGGISEATSDLWISLKTTDSASAQRIVRK